MHNDKNDDDSGGDDSDYETMEAGGAKTGKEGKPSSGNQVVIKKKVAPGSLSLKKNK